MTGKRLYERAQELGVITAAVKFGELADIGRAIWNQLAQEASVNVADEFALATHQERNRL